MSRPAQYQHRLCVILAGGDGTRLRQLTKCVSGDLCPKQFCPFLGGSTPLRATRQRIAHSFEPEQIVFVVNRAHERYYSGALADVRPSQVLIQPDNKGTAPTILLSLLQLNDLIQKHPWFFCHLTTTTSTNGVFSIPLTMPSKRPTGEHNP